MLQKVEIVLLSGYRGAGKDTLADILWAEQGYVKVSFAGALKEMCGRTFGIPMEWFEDRILKETPVPFWPYMSPRDILIKVGTDCLRNHFDMEIWLNLCARRVADSIQKVCKGNQIFKFVVTDCRFLNELSLPEKVLRELREREILPPGSEIWTTHCRIVRKKFTEEEIQALKDSGHDSDRQYLEMVPDIVVENMGTIQDLSKMAYAIGNCSKHLVGKISGDMENKAE